jgi:hypothetical protein
MRGRIDYRPRALVWNVFERRLDLLTSEGYAEQLFDRLLLTTGAIDRTLPFAGWTLPGVLLSAARRSRSKRRACRSAGVSRSSAPGRSCRW